MKKQALREIKDAADDELLKKLEDTRSELYFMRVNAKTGQTEKTADIRKFKRNIARILTEVNARKKVKQS